MTAPAPEKAAPIPAEALAKIAELVDILERLAKPAPGVKRLPAWMYGLIMGPLRRAREE